MSDRALSVRSRYGLTTMIMAVVLTAAVTGPKLEVFPVALGAAFFVYGMALFVTGLRDKAE